MLSIEAHDRFDVPTAAVGEPLWSAAALEPAPELTDLDMDVTSFDSLRAVGDAVDRRGEETLSVAVVATGLHAHSGTLVLRATSLADATDVATAALRFVVTA